MDLYFSIALSYHWWMVSHYRSSCTKLSHHLVSLNSMTYWISPVPLLPLYSTSLGAYISMLVWWLEVFNLTKWGLLYPLCVKDDKIHSKMNLSTLTKASSIRPFMCFKDLLAIWIIREVRSNFPSLNFSTMDKCINLMLAPKS